MRATRHVSISLLLVLVSTVGAAAAPAPAMSVADQKTYAAQLAKGRSLENAGKYADAIAAFEAGLVVAPDDATLLGEIGASAYLAKDLAKAETATRKAIEAASAPNVRGASLYNLGRIQEDRKDTAGAIASYVESLRVRPNSIVRARLAKLDPKAAAALDPYKPVPLAGPFASLDAYCKTLSPNQGDDDMTCACGADPAQTTPAVVAPYAAVQLFSRHCAYHAVDASYADYKLGVQLASGWYVMPVEHVDVSRRCNVDYTFADAKAQDVAAAAGNEVVVRYGVDASCSYPMGSEAWTESKQIVVGLGASKVPSATPVLLVARHESEIDGEPGHSSKPKVTVDVALQYAWKHDGTFTVTGKTTGIDSKETGGLLGKHAFVFP